MKLSMKSAQVLFASIALISLLTSAMLSVNYIEYWKCIIDLDLSVLEIKVSPIQLGATEVDQVTVDITFSLINPTGYGELKTQHLYYEITLENNLINRETIFTETKINAYSNRSITSKIKLTEVKGEKLSLLKISSQLVWNIMCVLKLYGLLGETRRTYHISYVA